MSFSRSFSVVSAFLIAILVSCTSPTWKSQSNRVVVEIAVPFATHSPFLDDSGRFLLPVTNPVGALQTVTLSISGSDFDQQTRSGVPDSLGRLTVTFEIPPGTNRVINAESRSDLGTVISRGTSTTAILPGVNSISLNLLPVANPTLFNTYTIPSGGVIIAELSFTAADIAANYTQARIYFGSSSYNSNDFLYFIGPNGTAILSTNIPAIQSSGYVSLYPNIGIGTYYLVITSKDSINFYGYPQFYKYNPLS